MNKSKEDIEKIKELETLEKEADEGIRSLKAKKDMLEFADFIRKAIADNK